MRKIKKVLECESKVCYTIDNNLGKSKIFYTNQSSAGITMMGDEDDMHTHRERENKLAR